jgi:hypothetical protein
MEVTTRQCQTAKLRDSASQQVSSIAALTRKGSIPCRTQSCGAAGTLVCRTSSPLLHKPHHCPPSFKCHLSLRQHHALSAGQPCTTVGLILSCCWWTDQAGTAAGVLGGTGGRGTRAGGTKGATPPVPAAAPLVEVPLPYPVIDGLWWRLLRQEEEELETRG